MRQSRLTLTAEVLATLVALSCRGDGDGPTGPQPPAGALRFNSLSAGYYHTCGLATGGQAYCWGGNALGVLGDGTRTTRNLPTAVAGGLTLTTLDAGAGHTCGLISTGQAYCWGWNDEGQLGDETFAPRDMPVAVAGGLTFTAVSAGHAHSCGLRSDGVAYCWGDDSHGQLGDGGPGVETRSPFPVPVEGDQRFALLSAGYYQTCALTPTGVGYCWGWNVAGQNGDGTTADRHVPTIVAGEERFTLMSPGDRFVCGVTAGGATYCWGANRHGELGDGAPTGSLVPVPLAGAPSFSSVFTSMGTSTIPSVEAYGCGVRGDGQTSCWGGALRAMWERTEGQFLPLGTGIRFQSIAPGPQHVCGLSRDSYAFCGGANYAGQLGDGTFQDRSSVVPVHGPNR